MIEILVGLLVLLFLPEEERGTDYNRNDEIIRPILMEDFHDGDFGDS